MRLEDTIIQTAGTYQDSKALYRVSADWWSISTIGAIPRPCNVLGERAKAFVTLARCVPGKNMACRCLLELHTIAAKKAEGGGEFDVAMTSTERLRLAGCYKADLEEFGKRISTVSWLRVVLAVASMMRKIHRGIRAYSRRF